MADPISVLSSRIDAVRNRLSAAENAYEQAYDKYEELTGQLERFRSQLNNAVRSVSEYGRRYRRLQRQLSGLEESFDRIDQAYRNARRRVREVIASISAKEQDIVGARQQIKEAFERLREARDSLLNGPVVTATARTSVRITFNAYTGKYFTKIDLGAGFNVDNGNLEDMLEGTLTKPSVNFEDLVFSTNPLLEIRHISGYYRANSEFHYHNRDKYAYLASERFVDWASPETLIQEIAAGIVLGPASAERTIKEIRRQVALEFDDVLAWIKNTAMPPGAVDTYLGCVLACMVGDNPSRGINFSDFSHSMDVITVPYRYELWPKYDTHLSRDYLYIPEYAPIDPVESQHAAFYLTFNYDNDTDPRAAARSALDNFDRNRLRGEGGSEAQFNQAREYIPGGSRRSTNPNVYRVLRGMDYADTIDREEIDSRVSRLIVNKLGLDQRTLETAYTDRNQLVIDLSASPVATSLKEIIQRYAMGSDSDVYFTRCEFDILSYRLDIDAVVHHSEEMTLREAWAKTEEWANERGRDTRREAEDLFGHSPQISFHSNSAQQAVGRLQSLENELSSLDNRRNNLEAELASVLNRFNVDNAELRELRRRRNDLWRRYNEAKRAEKQFRTRVNDWVVFVNHQVALCNRASKFADSLVAEVNWLIDEWNRLTSSTGGFMDQLGLGNLPIEPFDDNW